MKAISYKIVTENSVMLEKIVGENNITTFGTIRTRLIYQITLTIFSKTDDTDLLPKYFMIYPQIHTY